LLRLVVKCSNGASSVATNEALGFEKNLNAFIVLGQKVIYGKKFKKRLKTILNIVGFIAFY
jgi:hypothetical protein